MSDDTGKKAGKETGKETGPDSGSGKAEEASSRRARESVEEIEIRLGGLFDAVSGGFREMADRMRPLTEAVQEAAENRGHVHVERRVGVGSVAEFIDAMNAPSRPAPEHSVQQTDSAWTLEARLPDTTLPEIRIDIRPGRLTVSTPRHHLVCSIPEDFDEAAMEMGFVSDKLTLKAPRGGAA